MEYEENAEAKSTRRWVTALAIIEGIGVISSIIGLITLISMKSSNYASLRDMGEVGIELISVYQAQSTPLNLIIQGLLVIGQLIAVVLLFRGLSSVKKGFPMDQTPFYLLFGIWLINTIYSIAMGLVEWSAGYFITIAVSLLIFGIPFWKAYRYNKSKEENRE